MPSRIEIDESAVLVAMSLLSLLFSTFHLAGDIVYGYEMGQRSNLAFVPIAVVWLYGSLVLADRASGHIIVLLLSILGMFVPYIHMGGKGIGLESRLAHTDGHFFFAWTLIALGSTSLFSVILCARRLWPLRRGRRR